ncbi:MAG TPA: hypothetical protein VNU01_10560 [Egibacteraceae bacterium]|nr:hypothetical protein [Egibacteraceae bacterium]
MLSEAAVQGRLAEALGEAGGAWERGWVLAAMGRFGEALTVLEDAMSGPERARALGTRASVYRQLSLHELAERDDDAGLAATDDPAVRAGLLVGKVADALGLGLRGEWRPRALLAADSVAAAGDWRQRLRLAWVTGETAMYEGAPDAATPHFAEAVTRAVEHGARRHETKSHLFLGAAHAALGNTAAAQGHARAALSLARDTGARPLQWAAALVLAEAGERPDEHVDEARRVLAAILDGLPDDLRAAALARDPARWLLGG